MFKLYLGKVLFALQRQLTMKELEKVREFFDKGYPVNYTIEYLK